MTAELCSLLLHDLFHQSDHLGPPDGGTMTSSVGSPFHRRKRARDL